MSLETAKNPLQIKTDCISTVCEVRIETDAPDAVERKMAEHILADGKIVIWQMDRIIFGRWQSGHIALASGETIQPEFWQELRIFNENEELHLRRVRKGFRGRYRKDEPAQGGCCPYVDSFSRFWGTANDTPKDGYATLIDEQRKLRLVIPVEDESADWYGLETRNYIGSDKETGLSGYIDYRFVHIASAKEGK